VFPAIGQMMRTEQRRVPHVRPGVRGRKKTGRPGFPVTQHQTVLLSEALGAPGSPQRTWDNDDWFPMLSHKGATALNSLGQKHL
jgi:hypothetical protein